jgi:hypothetical protein
VEGRVALRATRERERVDDASERPIVVDALSVPRRPHDGIWRFAWVISVLTFVLHLFAQMRMKVPVVQADEGGYLGNARFLAQGIGRTRLGYASGYSLLLVPSAVFSHDPLTAYHLSLVVNALLAASMPLLTVFLLRRVLPHASTTAIAFAALVAVVYPAWSGVANLTLSDNALIPTVLATACVIAVAGCSAPRWCLAAVLAGYASWANPRGVLVVVAFVLTCAIVTRIVDAPRAAVLGIAVAAVSAIGGRILNVTISGTSNVNQVDNSKLWSGALRAILHPALWSHAFADIVGRVLYVGTATLGLAIIGAIVLGASLRPLVARRADARAAVALFSLTALVLTLLFDALNAVKSESVGYLLYGRYVEAVLAPVLVVGAAWLLDEGRHRPRRTLGYAGLVAGLAVLVGAFEVLQPRNISPSVNKTNVLALLVYFRHVHRSLDVVLLATVAMTAILLALIRLDRRVGACLVVAFLAYSSWAVYDSAVSESVTRATQVTLVDAVTRLERAHVDTSCVIVDGPQGNAGSGWHIASYEFRLPKSRFRPFTAPTPACGPLVVSNDPNVPARFPGARPVSYENGVPIALWVMLPRLPSDVREELSQERLFEPDTETQDPNSTYNSMLRLTARHSTTSRVRVRVDVRHLGTAPWPGTFAPLHRAGGGAVALEVQLSDPDDRVLVRGTCAVPRTIFPGDDVPIDCSMPVSVPPGDYVVSVRLSHANGHATFTAIGNTVATAPITLRA